MHFNLETLSKYEVLYPLSLYLYIVKFFFPRISNHGIFVIRILGKRMIYRGQVCYELSGIFKKLPLDYVNNYFRLGEHTDFFRFIAQKKTSSLVTRRDDEIKYLYDDMRFVILSKQILGSRMKT